MNTKKIVSEKSDPTASAESTASSSDPGRWRDLLAYWILGLCNTYGFVVMLSAAHDIIASLGDGHTKSESTETEPNARLCNTLSTGTVLLADIIPAMIFKVLSPFIPLWINFRIAFCCALAAGGFILVGLAEVQWVALLGVVFTSIGAGLGAATYLIYSAKYHINVISAWASGTGAAGIAGSLSYAGLIQLGVSPVTTLLIMLVIPVLEAIAFWIILRKPENLPKAPEPKGLDNQGLEINENLSNKNVEKGEIRQEKPEEDTPLVGFKNQMRYLPHLLIYIIPLATVYLFEYFINQGLFELIYFSGIWLNQQSQYRWLLVDYQIGVFISRSSVNIIQFDKIWIMSVLQFINVIYIVFEVLYFFTPNIWIIFGIVLWEGILGGGAYVNTFYRISKEVTPQSRKQFAIGMTALSDSIGISLAGICAIPTHNAICRLASPIR